ncbi:MAG: DUF1801 domain-containing protein [Alphaproteobacteria bacterium]|nr:DUF1801 domain-containing protein [Alphaproteobacteria bacterium]MBU1525721.1 DUF1801 domain-containing protein [Alphaproteobacteria bacterium]MBU2117600.1 DUF1801 domain-containing protein [Alphaproteobacteria bacterium]MBU2351898.1 DUF1801 domain-containing protein [Alphaproteobacteria bacterium]MBU2382752.1 DUF1801 domain-containing protein [Alphaproteobacteria bacterium]
MDKARADLTPDHYAAAFDDWRGGQLHRLRAAALAVDGMEEVIKWGHLVYLSNGPVALIRAEGKRVLFGLWRGQRLLETEPRLKSGGQYEMATISLAEGETLDPVTATALVRAGTALNAELGDPTKAAKAR